MVSENIIWAGRPVQKHRKNNQEEVKGAATSFLRQMWVWGCTDLTTPSLPLTLTFYQNICRCHAVSRCFFNRLAENMITVNVGPLWTTMEPTLHSSSSRSKTPILASIRRMQGSLSEKSMRDQGISSFMYSSCSSLKTCCREGPCALSQTTCWLQARPGAIRARRLPGWTVAGVSRWHNWCKTAQNCWRQMFQIWKK